MMAHPERGAHLPKPDYHIITLDSYTAYQPAGSTLDTENFRSRDTRQIPSLLLISKVLNLEAFHHPFVKGDTIRVTFNHDIFRFQGKWHNNGSLSMPCDFSHYSSNSRALATLHMLLSRPSTERWRPLSSRGNFLPPRSISDHDKALKEHIIPGSSTLSGCDKVKAFCSRYGCTLFTVPIK